MKINAVNHLIACLLFASGAWIADPASGLVRSRALGGRPLGFRDRHGYVRLALWDGNVKRQVYAHRVLWEAVMGKIPRGKVINHKNSNKADNRIENLELLTPAANAAHASRAGRLRRGEQHPFAKITEAQVLEFRRAMNRPGFLGGS